MNEQLSCVVCLIYSKLVLVALFDDLKTLIVQMIIIQTVMISTRALGWGQFLLKKKWRRAYKTKEYNVTLNA